MAGGAQDSEDGINGINVTPLVDVALVLLIIFMVTAKLITQQSIPLDLPKTVNGSDQVQTVFSVVLAADGTTLVDSRAVTGDDAILSMAKKALEGNKELRAVIKADNAVPHGRVIHVLDLLKQAQITKIAFGVSRQTGVGGPGTGPGTLVPPAATGATPK
ncbi:MAG: biopolymer transporter ExbD [Polyangiaceae bacterium]